MIIAPFPDNEEERLASLRELQILDTGIEESFEEVTHLIARICDVPIAHISLIDKDRQWFKSIQGFNASEVPRKDTFCSHTILQRDLLIVEDTLEDKRFFDHPHVIGEPNVRFYAGAPIESRDHFALGTLCVIDKKPRHLEEIQIDALKVLSRQVANQFELRRLINHLAEAKAREATMALVVTYNHEINNPLSVIKVLAALFKDKIPEGKSKLLHDSIDRIVNSVKNIETTLRKVGLELETYSGNTKMMKVSKD